MLAYRILNKLTASFFIVSRNFAKQNAKEKIKCSENYLLGFLFQHMHNKTINVRDIEDTITLKKISSEMFIRLFIVFKWLFSACVLQVKSTQQQRSLFTEKAYEIKAFDQ